MASHETVAQEEDFKSLTLSDKLSHKAWKARLQGYEELYNKLKYIDNQSDPQFKMYLENIKMMALDSNAAALDAAYKVIQLFITLSDLALKVRKELLPCIIEKGLLSARSSTKAKAIEILLDYVFIDSPDPIMDELMNYFENKQPKLIAASISAIYEIIKTFGIPPISCKKLFKELPKIFSNSDKFVRVEANKLTVEIYSWIGKALMPFLELLKPIQLKELNESFEALPKEKRIPERRLKSHIPKETVANEHFRAVATENEAVSSPHEEAGNSVDPYDLAEPIEILSKIPPTFTEMIHSANWKERKEALENVLTAIKVIRIADAKYNELVSTLSKRIADTNINVVILAANALEALGKGLRRSFNIYSANVLPAALERVKEKKTSVVEALRGLLDTISDYGNINDYNEHIIEALGHKNPQVKSEALSWLSRAWKKVKKPPTKPEIIPLCEHFLKCFDDGDNTVREAAFEAFATLLKIAGERLLGSTIEKIDKIKMAKVNEYVGSIDVDCKSSSFAACKPIATKNQSVSNSINTVSKVAKVSPLTQDSNVKPSSSIPPKPFTTNVLQKKPTIENIKKPLGVTKPTVDTVPVFSFTDESADEFVSSLLPANLVTGLSDSIWKARLSAIESLIESLDSVLSDTHPEALVRFSLKRPGFKDSNLQVIGKLLDFLSKVTLRESQYSSLSNMKSWAILVVSGVIEKMSEIKLKKQSVDLLLDLSERVSLSFIFSQVCESIKSHKNPKVIIEALKFIQQGLIEFGISGLSVKPLIEALKSVLGNSNAGIRSAAVACLTTLRVFLGPDLRMTLNDIPGGILTTIDAEFTKVASDAPLLPTRSYKPSSSSKKDTISNGRENSATTTTSSTEGELGEGGESIEDLIPRTNLSSSLTQSLVGGLQDANWKVRKESLEAIMSLIEGANKKITPDGISDILPGLKGRFTDSNKNLISNSLDCIRLLAESIGKPFEKLIKPYLNSLLLTFTDNKIQVRMAATKALDTIYDASKNILPIVLSEVGIVLSSSESPMLRKDLLIWIVSKLTPLYKEKKSSNELFEAIKETIFIMSICQCLVDRNAEVRKPAQSCLYCIADFTGVATIREKIKEKPSLLSSVNTLLESYQGQIISSKAPPVLSSSPKVPNPNNSNLNKQPTTHISGNSAATLKASAATSKIPVPSKTSTLKFSSSSLVKEGGSGLTTAAALQTLPFPINLFPTNCNTKPQRIERDKGHLKFYFENVIEAGFGGAASSMTPGSYGGRKDLVDGLKEAIEPFLCPNICKSMFSDDFKEHLSSLSNFEEFFGSYLGRTEAQDLGGDKPPFEAISKNVLSISDLLYKYITVRLIDSTNATVLLKTLDFFEQVTMILEKLDYSWTEYEAGIILPYLVLKLGDPKEAFRLRVKGLLPLIGRIYPNSKLIHSFLLEPFVRNCKALRLKLELLEVLNELIEKSGNVYILANPPIKIVSLLSHVYIHEKDGSLRQSALKVLLTVMATKESITVEDMLKWSGKPGLKETALLEEKLRKTKLAPVPPETPKHGTLTPKSKKAFSNLPLGCKEKLPTPKKEETPTMMIIKGKTFSLDLDKLDLPKLSSYATRHIAESQANKEKENQPPIQISSGSDIVHTFSSKLEELSLAENKTLPMTEFNDKNLVLDVILQNIGSEELQLSNKGLYLLESKLPRSTDGNFTALGNESAWIFQHASKIVTVFMTRLETLLFVELPKTKSHHERVPIVDLISRLTELLQHFINFKRLTFGLSREAIHLMLQVIPKVVIINWSWEGSSDTEQLKLADISKHVNTVLIKMIEFGDKNHLFACLFFILKERSIMLAYHEETVSKMDHSYTETIMKCIWRLTRSISDALPPKAEPETQLYLKSLLKDCHAFLLEAPPQEWKKRASEGKPLSDLPLKTVKTLLHEIVTVLGQESLEEAKNALGKEWFSSMVVQYMKLMLERKEMTPPPTTPSHSFTPVSNAALLTQRPQDVQSLELTEAEAKKELQDVFDLITDKATSKEGLLALYQFKNTYPAWVPLVNEFMNSTGNFFKGYIQRGLANIADEQRLVNITKRLSLEEQEKLLVKSPDEYKQKLEHIQKLFYGTAKESSPYPTATSIENAIGGSMNEQNENQMLNENEKKKSRDLVFKDAEKLASVSMLKERLAKFKNNL